MRDLDKRRALSEQLRWLIGGRITNDAFDDFLHEERCLGSEDRTLDEIAWWAWTLYSDTRTYRLLGKDAASDDARAAAIRAILFLRSGADYDWPTLQAPAGIELLRMAGEAWWWPTTGCLLFALWNYGLTVRGITLGPLFLIASGLVGVACVAAGRQAKRLMAPRIDAFESAGDRECWPFKDATELADALRPRRLLAP